MAYDILVLTGNSSDDKYDYEEIRRIDQFISNDVSV